MAARKKPADPLETYKAKRDFRVTSEPADGGQASEHGLRFVVQKHWASRLHYDFRLEWAGTMKSWAVPKGPSYDPKDKRMAVQVEDHPISYNSFEGQIPAGQYGAGKVIVWDAGIWEPVGDPQKGLRDGNLKFQLQGHKLHGNWVLVRMRGKNENKHPWLLIKEKDEYARPSAEYSVVDEMPDSVAAAVKRAAKSRAPAAGKADTPGKRAALPATLKPQLATLVEAPPGDSDDWVFELKFDGYRMLARIEGKAVRLVTRNGHDWTARLQTVAAALLKMNLPDGWYDGEIVVLDDQGVPDFQALQNAFDAGKTSQIVYFLFDAPYFNGHDLRGVPLVERRALLAACFKKNRASSIRFSDTFEVAARDIIASACKLGLEGVIGKRRDSTYAARRSADWIKLKCGQRQEFVIGGYTDPQGSRSGLGSLMLGVRDAQGKLRYAGNVGTGFSDKTLNDLTQKLSRLRTDESPFGGTTGIDNKANWVRPTLIAEVAFGSWTKTGRIRHSVFHGLRSDKKPSEVTREHPQKLEAANSASTLPAGLKITHPERVIDPSSGTTKMDLIRYYALVAPLLLEHLAGRPVSLVRAPDGIESQLFFQKHLDSAKMPGVRQLPQKLDPDHARLLEIASLQGLFSATQMNVVEFHTWNAAKTSIGKPDRMTFDLDPGDGVSWKAIQEGTHLMRHLLQELGLQSFLKTSGGKGLHVVVPLQRRHDWATVKGFSQAIVQHLASTIPNRFVAKSGPRNRVGKIFVDYLRNGFGATTVAAWSARARSGMGVSVPLRWDELDELDGPTRWRVGNIHERLDQGNTPWEEYRSAAQTLTRAMKALDYTPEK